MFQNIMNEINNRNYPPLKRVEINEKDQEIEGGARNEAVPLCRSRQIGGTRGQPFDPANVFNTRWSSEFIGMHRRRPRNNLLISLLSELNFKSGNK